MDDQKPPTTERWDAFTDERKALFLRRLIECGGYLSEAAEVCGVDRGTVYKHMRDSEVFAAQVAEARKVGKFALPFELEDELHRRIFDGIKEPVYYQGRQCVDDQGRPLFVMKKTDASIIFALKGEMPEKYKEKFEHSGPGGNPLNQTVVVYVPDNKRGPRPATAVAPPTGDSTETKTS